MMSSINCKLGLDTKQKLLDYNRSLATRLNIISFENV